MGCKVFVVGRLAKDVELKYIQGSGRAMLQNTVAWNKVSGGEKRGVFLDFAAFGRTAENISKYMAKGDQIFLTGDLDEESWQGRDGQERKKMKLIVTDFEFVGHSKRNQEAFQPATQAPQPQMLMEADSANPIPPYMPPVQQQDTSGYQVPEDDVPF